MSHSPVTAVHDDLAGRYQRNFSLMHRLLHEGKSWSGHERNRCFLNTGGRRFANISAASGLDFLDDGRSLALVDWDFDGKLDLWVGNRTGPRVRLLRNQSPGRQHFVSLLLEGRDGNRDAIGARATVVLQDPSRKLSRTVYAGSGFLSQSSRRLHFGLGDHAKIALLIIRWPDGSQEEFADLPADCHYVVRQGAGAPQPWTPPPVTIDINQPADPPQTVAVSGNRVVLLSRPLLPRAEFDALDGSRRPLLGTGKRRLVHLWAESCAACVRELHHWSAAGAELKVAGLHVLALNVDPNPTDRLPQAQRLAQREPDWEVGLADSDLVRCLDAVQRAVLDREIDIPLPSTFLVDERDRVLAIYLGSVSADQLLRDARLPDLPPSALRDAAVPLAGRWGSEPFAPDPTPIAHRFQQAGYRDDAVEYLRQFLAFYSGPGAKRTTPADEAQETLLQSARIEAWYMLGELYRQRAQQRQAVAAFRQVLQLNPDHRAAHMELGYALLEARRPDEALYHFRHAVRIKPDAADAWAALGLAQVKLGDARQAAQSWREALKRRPGWSQAQNNLAWLLATHADPRLRDGAAAVTLAEQACRAARRSNFEYLNTLAAAFAAVGRFDEAVSTTREALRLLPPDEAPRHEAEMRRRLRQYQAGQPLRASDHEPPQSAAR